MKKMTALAVSAVFLVLILSSCSAGESVVIDRNDIKYLDRSFCTIYGDDLEIFNDGIVINDSRELGLLVKRYHLDSNALKGYDRSFFRKHSLVLCMRFSSPLTRYEITSAEAEGKTVHIDLKTVRSSKKTIMTLSCGGFLMTVPKSVEEIEIRDI